jgi:hypothetical protein
MVIAQAMERVAGKDAVLSVGLYADRLARTLGLDQRERAALTPGDGTWSPAQRWTASTGESVALTRFMVSAVDRSTALQDRVTSR